MNKTTYLNTPVVSEFILYLSQILEGAPFLHEFNVRDRRLPASYKWLTNKRLYIRSLEDAFDRYWWDKGGFDQNKEILDTVSKIIHHANLAEESPNATDLCLEAIHQVLKWGAGGTGQRLYTANMKWARDRSSDIVARMQRGRQEMSSETPNVSVFSDANGPRMNAGFTKYYSLACDDVVIYDGRVGAALGLLVRNFCLDTNRPQVPSELAFRWGAQNPGKRDPALALQRNPSDGTHIFAQLPTAGGAQWAFSNIQANWILSAAKQKSLAEWCQTEDGLRRIEAALFTIGYEIPRPHSVITT